MAQGDRVIARTVFRGAWADGRRVWPQLLVTDIVYKLLAFAVLTPLLGLALRVGVSLSGSSVLADQDILYFLLSPVGLAVLVVAAGLSLTIVALEQACLMAIGVAAAENSRVTVIGALRFVLARARSVIGLALRVVGRCLLYVAPFLVGLGLIYAFLLGEFDINYYLTEQPPAFTTALGLAVLLFGGLAGLLVPRLIGWGLALPLVLFEDVAANQALAESERRVSGHRAPIAGVLVFWGAAAVLVWTAVPALILATGRLVAPYGEGNVKLVLTLMLLLAALWVLANLLITWVNASAFSLLVARLYEHFGGGREEIVSRLTSEEDLGGTRRVQLSPGRVLAGLLVLALLAGGGGWLLLRGVQGNDDVVIIAHRGAAGVAPENTMASIEEALEQGADYIEIDVQETVDGEVVVIHDSDLMKVGGVDLKIWDATWDGLQEIDVGSWFAPEFSEERVPHLRDVLERTRGRAKVDIELKYYGHDENLEQRVIDIVEELALVDDVVVMSLKYGAVETMRALRPDWTLGLLTATAVGDLTELDADFLAVATGLATRSFVRRAQGKGKDVYVWTVNDPVQMFNMMNLGVDGIITDEPGVAGEVLAWRAELSSAERLLVGIAVHFGAAAPDPPTSDDAD